MLKVNNDFMKLNENLVYSIVNKYGNYNNKEDLYQIGMIAVLKASKLYDKSKNVKFSTYAYKYILGEILQYLRENKNIKQSKEVVNIYKQILKLKEDYYILTGKQIPYSILSEKLDITEAKIEEIENICKFDKDIDDEVVVSKETLDKNDLIALKTALTSLNKEEKEFIYQRYYENKTQTEIANINNCNQVKIYRYEQNVLSKLKNKMS